jgi:hypothetical protein
MSRAVLDKLLARSLEHYQILFNHQMYHNHMAHHLGALHFLGASDEKLEEVFKVMSEVVEPYEPSPHQITRANWRDSLGDKQFCKAYKDFFEQELTGSGDHWQRKLLDFLLENEKQPLINGILCGLVHPLIHVGYAFELDSRTVGIEALTLAAVCYDEMHELVEKLPPLQSGSKSALQVFEDICADDRCPSVSGQFFDNMRSVLTTSTELVLSYYSQWKINRTNLEQAIEELFDLTVYVYGATHAPDQIVFSFVLLHLTTGAHALRVIQPHLKDQQMTKRILSQLFFYAIVMYVASGRPRINKTLIDDYKIDETKHNWDYVIQRTFKSEFAENIHLVKVVYALRELLKMLTVRKMDFI